MYKMSIKKSFKLTSPFMKWVAIIGSIVGVLSIVSIFADSVNLLDRLHPTKTPTPNTSVEINDSYAIVIGDSAEISGGVQINIQNEPQQSELPKIYEEAKRTVNEILDDFEAIQSFGFSLPLKEDQIYQTMTNRLNRDSYDVDALLLRGQASYTNARAAGGTGYRLAIQDFLNAIEIDDQLADPHYGLGTVYYQLAIFDLVKRGRFEIYKKGALRMNQETGLLEMKPPMLILYSDKRNQSVLQLGLNEFQTGNQLRQFYRNNESFVSVLFASEDIDNRVNSLRILLGYEPALSPDEALISVFTSFIVPVEGADGFGKLFEIEAP
jgi:hypothetical protein